ncbi:hypothetical protein V8E53_006861 [Lactarius tabidus]
MSSESLNDNARDKTLQEFRCKLVSKKPLFNTTFWGLKAYALAERCSYLLVRVSMRGPPLYTSLHFPPLAAASALPDTLGPFSSPDLNIFIRRTVAGPAVDRLLKVLHGTEVWDDCDGFVDVRWGGMMLLGSSRHSNKWTFVACYFRKSSAGAFGSFRISAVFQRGCRTGPNDSNLGNSRVERIMCYLANMITPQWGQGGTSRL